MDNINWEPIIDAEPTGYPSNSETEERSRNKLKDLLNPKFIRGDIRVMDKYPNFDATLDVLNGKNITVGQINIQVKTLDKSYVDNPGYSFKDGFMSACEWSLLPVIAFVVDNINSKAYWYYIDDEVLFYYKTNKKGESFHLSFPKNNIIDGKDERYISIWQNIFQERFLKFKKSNKLEKELQELQLSLRPPTTISSDFIKDIQIFLDFYNSILERDVPGVRRILYSDYWKIGIGIVQHTISEFSYVLIPLAYGYNDLIIREVSSEKAVEMLYPNDKAWALIYAVGASRNKFKEKPKQYAFQMLKNDVLNTVKKNQLPVPDSYVANEFIFGLIDSFTNYFGFDKFTQTCDLNYLKFLIEKILPVVEAENKNYRDGLTELEACIDSNERQNFSNSERIKKAIKLIEQGHISKVKVKLYSNKFDFTFLYYYISLLEGKGFKDAIRNLEPNKKQTPIGMQYWNGWDRNIIYKNVKIFYENFFRSYELLIKTNFENLIDELNIKEDGDLVIVKIRGEDFGKPFLERIFLKSIVSNSSMIQRYAVYHEKDCPVDTYKMHQLNDYKCEFEGIEYKVIMIAAHPLEFLFDKLPFFQYANEILLKKLSDFFLKMSR